MKSYSPVLHRNSNYLNFSKVEWPITKYGKTSPSNIAIIEIGDTYFDDKDRFTVVSMFEDKLYPRINYKNDNGHLFSSSINWFAHQIANRLNKA